MTRMNEYLRRLKTPRQRWCVVGYWAFRSLASLLLAAPVASALGQTVMGFPRGEAELFQPGGILMLDALREVVPVVVALRWPLSLGLACWMMLAPLALGALLVAQQDVSGKQDFAEFASRSLRAYPRQVLLELLSWGAFVGLAAGWIVWMTLVSSVLPAGPNEQRDDLLALALTLPFVLMGAWLRPVLDLSRVAQASGAGVLRSLSLAWRCGRRAPLGLFASWCAPASLGVAVFASATHGSLLIGTDANSSEYLVWSGVVLGQAGYVALTLSRAAWLSRAAAWLATTAHAAWESRSSDPEDEVLDGPLGVDELSS